MKLFVFCDKNINLWEKKKLKSVSRDDIEEMIQGCSDIQKKYHPLN